MPAEPPQSKLKRRASRKETEEPPLKYDGGQSWEIELKRNRGEISCAECRRLKIKCDKQIPCQSCQRRGCAALCPNGSLSTGQGTRFVLAATEHLHRRISRMSERIRQLEEALGALHSQQNGPEPHPLLRLDPIGSEDDVIDEKPDSSSVANDAKVADVIDAFGTLSISTHGISQFFGPTGGPELLLMSEMRRRSRQLSSGRALTPDDHSASSKSPASLSNEQFTFFSRAFPFTPMGSASTVQQLILSHLPAYDRACSLSETYLNRAAWIYQCISRTQLMAEVLPSVYNHVSANDNPGTGAETCPSDLALLFVIFAIACLMEAEPNDAEAEHYNQIARAATCIESVLEKPTLTTVQILRLMSIYSAMNNCENGDQESNMEESWSLLSLAAQLAQSVGLHRDSARWGLEDKIVQRRRLVFWDLFVATIWQSLSTGRPPAFSLQYVDCKFPEPGDDDSSEVDIDVDLSWIFRFSAECVSEVVAQMLSSKQPSYTTISELDRKVREFTIPEAADALVTGTGPTIPDETMTRVQRFHLSVLSHVRETVLLYIHRSYFAQAILEHPTNPLRSSYAPSFLAAYRASTTILKSVRDQVAVDHVLPSHFGAFWTFAFTAAIVFGTVVTHGPLSPLAAPAMTELELACQLFSKAGPNNYRAAIALPILQRLKEKARRALADSQKGDTWLPQSSLNDELSILAGHTRFLPPNIPVLETTVESPEPRPQERGDFVDQPHVAASSRYGDPATMAPLHSSSAPYNASASPIPAGSSNSWTTPLREPLPDFVALPNHQMQSISRQATRLQSQEDYGAAAPGFWPGQATTRPPSTRHVSYHEAQYASNPHDVDHLHHTLVAASHRPEMYDHTQDGGAQQHPRSIPRDARMTEMWSSFMRETGYDPTTQYRQA